MKIYKEINIILSDCENWKYPIEWIKNEYENENIYKIKKLNIF